MAYATIAGSAGPVYSESETGDFTADLPSSIASGNLLLMVVAYRHASGTAAISEWTQLALASNSSYTPQLFLFGKIASGSEGTTCTVTRSATGIVSCRAYRITGHYAGTITQAVEATTAIDYGSGPNPPSITPTWGSGKDTVYLTTAAHNTDAYTAVPSGWTDNQLLYDNGYTPTMGVGGKSSTAASEDPGSWSMAGYFDSSMITLAIRPAEAATATGHIQLLTMGVG